MRKIYDITQDIASCRIYPGDPVPEIRQVQAIADGDDCNLTQFFMVAHSGTHVDAPLHFIDDGKNLGEIGLEPFVGPCFVARREGDLSAKDAEEIVKEAKENGAGERILVAGCVTVTEEAARVFAASELLLYGNESQTVGPFEAPKAVHLIMLGAQIVLLEGIRMDGVPEGVYMLHAAPIALLASEGAPCRAYLIQEEETQE